LGGDFRQILPVITKGSRGEILNATTNSSKLWKHCKVLKITKNMRLKSDVTDKSQIELKEFADCILKIGDGLINLDENGEAQVKIPEEMCILEVDNPLLLLVNFVYPNVVVDFQKTNFFEDQTILALTLDVVEQVNDFDLCVIPGESKEYLSCDTPCKSDKDYEVQN
jgi:ATP-dependent DNA helicase PIF1